jgi:hypothetical protein
MKIAAFVSAIALGGAAIPAVAPQAPPASPPPTIILGLTLPSGNPAKVGVRSGDRATVSLANGPVFGFTPTVTDDGRVDLVVAEIGTDPQSGAEVVREFDRRVLDLGEPVKVEHNSISITVTWLETRKPPASAKDADEPCKVCCLFCQGELTCACYVETPCGRCCCSATCACDIGSRSSAESAPTGGLRTAGCSVEPVRR